MSPDPNHPLWARHGKPCDPASSPAPSLPPIPPLSTPTPFSTPGDQREGAEKQQPFLCGDQKGDGDRNSSEYQLFCILASAGYRDKVKDRHRLRMGKVAELLRIGIEPDMLARIWGLARVQGRNPGGLFAYWLQDRKRLIAKMEELAIRGNSIAIQAARTKRTAAEITAELGARVRLVE